ncbi:DUF192 domain-containing protein [Roseivivax marinus]|uniref:DUF192 domain-containing protein n=1 Tax=Roseivivax marinus TaxID=1379903 RepID=UPI00273DBA34|nr:DUF192 domain-containing protein [Roseivivax marinus]
MGNRGFGVIGTGAALTALMLAGPVAAECAADRIALRGDFGDVAFRVDVADTVEERAQGLMFVEEMPRFAGMLFVYDRPQPVAFWMKNTLIPLDMVFADARGVVQRVHAEAVPGDLTGIPGGDDIQYVLEINGGMAETLGIAPGAQMQHPAISDAAWACDDVTPEG